MERRRERKLFTLICTELGVIHCGVLHGNCAAQTVPQYRTAQYCSTTSCIMQYFLRSARFPTDHRAYFFDFDTEKLLGTRTPELATHAKRILKSNNIRQVTQYIKEKYEYLQQCNAFNRAKQLTQPGNCHQYAERLDRDMLQASLVAEQRTQRYGEPA